MRHEKKWNRECNTERNVHNFFVFVPFRLFVFFFRNDESKTEFAFGKTKTYANETAIFGLMVCVQTSKGEENFAI